jgi:Flp pilus assembly protein TadB
MKMKSIFGILVGAILILSSCATTNDVNGGGIFQKRKYNNGFYLNLGKLSKEANGTKDNEQVVSGKIENVNQEADQVSETLLQTDRQEEFSKAENQESVPTNAEKSKTNGATVSKSISNVAKSLYGSPIAKLAQKKGVFDNKKANVSKAPSDKGQLGYLIGLILLVILLLLLFTVLDYLLGGLLSWLVRIIIIVVIVVLILKLLDVI